MYPDIYTGFDEHMKQTLDMEFYRRIMEECYRTDRLMPTAKIGA